MSDKKSDPRNPFYILLVLVSFAFVVTALAYAVVPVLEQKAREAGSPPAPSAFRDSLRADGWLWLLGQGAAVVVLSLLSMGYDRLLRALKKAPASDTIQSRPTSPAGDCGPPGDGANGSTASCAS